MPGDLHALTGDDVDALVDVSGGVARIVRWGPSTGGGGPTASAEALGRAHPVAGLATPDHITLVPAHGEGFPGRPGLLGHRADGTGWAPSFAERVRLDLLPDGVAVTGTDRGAQLTLLTVVRLDADTGLLYAWAEVTNDAGSDYHLGGLTISLPVPGQATELLTPTGRWCGELQMVRSRWEHGAVTAENRRGRTSHDHLPLLFVGSRGFGEHTGEVWGAHLAWSGNSTVLAERVADGRRYLQLGELLHPGEVVLVSGGSYRTPEVIASYCSHGLTGASRRYHRHVRARPGHPGTEQPRKVLLNTWEAVYFDHDLDTLCRLADRAAAVGVERFVLDDGWFHGRRSDRSGLGDWWVDAEVWPDGLAPLIDHVRSLGMDFGLWVEPEMVSPDSDLHRAHPEWVLAVPGHEPPLARNQLVRDLVDDASFDDVLDRLDRLLTEHDIAYVKWDMNRDHVAAARDGRAATHAQTKRALALMEELARRHPEVELESCASGGGRIDLQVLGTAVRVWTSDCNDALERQLIQRGASLLVPPESMGAHIGPPRAHTTGRTQSLAFRAGTALFGHLGIEWNLLTASEAELDELAEAVALHRRHRALLHGGDVVRCDHPDPAVLVHGVVAPDRSEAMVAVVQLTSSVTAGRDPVVVNGLEPDHPYRITRVPLPGERTSVTMATPPAWWHDPPVLTGRQLAAHGLALPVMDPETILLLHLAATRSGPSVLDPGGSLP